MKYRQEVSALPSVPYTRRHTSRSMWSKRAKYCLLLVSIIGAIALVFAAFKHHPTADRPLPLPTYKPPNNDRQEEVSLNTNTNTNMESLTNTLRAMPKRNNALPDLIAANSQRGAMSDYQEHVVRVLVRAAGVDLAHALFDPQAVTEAEKEVLRNAESTSWLADRQHQWASGLSGRSHNGALHLLSAFDEAADVLWTAKQQLSIGISRLLKDQANAALYTEVYTVSTTARTLTAQRAFDAALEKVFSDYAHLLRKSIYLAQALTIRSVISAAKNAPHSSPLKRATGIMADLASKKWMRDTPSNADLLHTPVDLHLRLLLGLRFSETTRDAFKTRVRSVLSEYVMQNLASSAQGDDGKRELAELLRREVGVLDVRREWMFDDVGYWYFGTALGSPNYMPSATCTTLFRNDENNEGGRYVCNAEYLLYASSDMRGWFTRTGDAYNMFTTPETAFPHRIVSGGSNNQYLWEEEQVEMFRAGRYWNASVNTINDITIMDCSVDPWRVTEKLKDMSLTDQFNVRLSQVCVSGADGTFAAKSKPIISMANLKKLVNTQNTGDYAHVVRFSVDSVPVRTPPKQVVTSAFDDISILKMDVEWDEYRMVDAWATHELLAWAKHVQGSDTPFATYDMQSVLGDTFLSYSMYQSEIHIKHMDRQEVYPIVAVVNRIDGTTEKVQRSFLHELSLRSLGLLAVSSEYNPLGSSFRESVHAHIRYFLRSEVWMALKTFDERKQQESVWVSDDAQGDTADEAEAFQALVMDAAERAVGPAWCAAMNDSSFVDAAPHTPTAADDLDDLSWKSKGIADFSLKMLYVAKQSVSTGLWRLQHDPDMISMHAKFHAVKGGVAGGDVLRQAFVTAVEKVVRAYAASLRSAMQLAVDDAKMRAHSTQCDDLSGDMELTLQLLAVVRDIHHNTTVKTIKAAMLSLNNQTTGMDEYGEAVNGTVPVMPMPLLVGCYQSGTTYGSRAGFIVGRHIGCTDMMQLGVTGALCNGGYLLSAGTDDYIHLVRRFAAARSGGSYYGFEVEASDHVIMNVHAPAHSSHSVDHNIARQISVATSTDVLGRIINQVRNAFADADGPSGILSALRDYHSQRRKLKGRTSGGGVGESGVRAFDDIALLHMDDSAMSTAGMRRWAEADCKDASSDGASNMASVSHVAWHQVAIDHREPLLPTRVTQYRYLMFNRLGFLSHSGGHTVSRDTWVQFDLVHYSYFIKSEVWAAVRG